MKLQEIIIFLIWALHLCWPDHLFCWFKLKPMVESSLAAITAGVAFSGVNMVIGYLIGGVPPAQAVENTGVNLTAMDIG